MIELNIDDFEGFHMWASKWLNFSESYFIAKPEIQIDFFGGKSDDAYLVIDVFASSNTCTEYIFLVFEEKDEGRSMPLIFNFLFTHDYSLVKLLAWLESAHYTEHELGERILVGDLTIERRFSQSFKTVS